MAGEYTQDIMLSPQEHVIEAQKLQVGDVVEVAEGKKVFVKTVKHDGRRVEITAFGHPANEVWHFHTLAIVSVELLTFTEEDRHVGRD